MITHSRQRTSFTTQQKKVLEDFYRSGIVRPSKEEREQLGQKLGKDIRAINVRTDILFQYLNILKF